MHSIWRFWLPVMLHNSICKCFGRLNAQWKHERCHLVNNLASLYICMINTVLSNQVIQHCEANSGGMPPAVSGGNSGRPSAPNCTLGARSRISSEGGCPQSCICCNKVVIRAKSSGEVSYTDSSSPTSLYWVRYLWSIKRNTMRSSKTDHSFEEAFIGSVEWCTRKLQKMKQNTLQNTSWNVLVVVHVTGHVTQNAQAKYRLNAST